VYPLEKWGTELKNKDMGKIIKISKTDSPEQTLKALSMLEKKKQAPKTKSLAEFFGKMPDVFGDGLTYQKQMRNEW
jgi:hypothetical protein